MDSDLQDHQNEAKHTKLDEKDELQNITRIASDLHQRRSSIVPHHGGDAAPAAGDPSLDPSSPQFDHYKWAQRTLSTLNRSGISTQPQGLVFQDVSVSGSGSSLQYQETVLSSFIAPFRAAARLLSGHGQRNSRRRILRDFHGLLDSGELLLVLGRPGSGCTTFLKTLCGHLEGLRLEPSSALQFRGISFAKMIQIYRGEVVYNQEVEEHFPHLTVGETLSFAAAARVPQQRPPGVSRDRFVDTAVKVVMAIFGLTHTYSTKVGDSFVKGVSGGERKRVSIAEMFLSRARLAAWDNSTRGLDAATALQFIKALRLAADFGKSCHAVAAYQASQSMYDIFDKVMVLYEGHEVYFGPCDRAVAYFEDMGWHKDAQQVAPDFLTAVTNPSERRPKQGMQDKVPKSAPEFAAHWRRSTEYEVLKAQITKYKQDHPVGQSDAAVFQNSHEKQQARHTRVRSPYLLSVPMQIRLCLRRAFQRMRNDIPTTMSTVVVQTVLSFIIGSIFYNSPNTTDAFFQKGAVVFFAVLLNAIITITEIMMLYGQRPIVEKQARYAFVHPFTEALASTLIELPIKLIRCSIFSVVLYFLVNLRREAGNFFIFYLFLITAILTMSAIFRTVAASTKTISQAMAVAGILVLCFVVYSGFIIPQAYMHPWFSWIRWLNPIFYAFEALLANEFHNREFPCAMLVPPYGQGDSFICGAVGAVPGKRFINGDDFLMKNYNYSHSHLWRNYGILVSFMVVFHCLYFTATEFHRTKKSKAEALVFRPGHAPSYLLGGDVEDGVTGKTSSSRAETLQDDYGRMKHLPRHADTLTWKSINYDIPVKEGTRRLLHDVNGWVKPGTLTALMGVSGAGKTTLLDVLAQRTSIGIVTGDILVSGQPTSAGYTRRTGFVQQQDLHLETTTVREALRFSALLRQPRSVSKQSKYGYVEEVIHMLGIGDFAEAIVGRVGEGLNVEQRKLLSIGVELVAKPSLLVFLDEPTSGLDSQSSWAICAFLRRLADHGQTVLATIHQPSSLLFQTFDRLLFLAQGGKTVYFGEIGPQSRTLLDYFARNGARSCDKQENPAEYMLQVVSGQDSPGLDWVSTWNSSPERRGVLAEIDRLSTQPQTGDPGREEEREYAKEFSLPLYLQFWHVAARVFSQYYRQPEYIFTKYVLGIASGLFIGFSFWKADYTQQGFQNALFGIFLLATIFPMLVNQIIPKFVVQRSLYEVRERPSRVYSWKVFILSQMLVEVPWQVFLGVCAWASFYYAVFGTSATSESQALVLLLVVQFYVYAATIAQMVVAGVSDPTLGTMLAVLMFGMSFIFNGVMQPPDALPGFWIFMWRVSPFTYYVSALASSALHGRKVTCSETELSVFDPPAGQTCGQYLRAFLQKAPGTLNNPAATASCQYCSLSSADQYLAARRIVWDQRWRNYGIFVCYMVFNVFGTVTLYYLFRVRTSKARKPSKK